MGLGREPTAWLARRAWRLAGDRLRVVVCPERGAKIASLLDTATGREWLVPAPLRPLRPLTYGALWSAYECCGWDEVCPTVAECAYPGAGPAAGRRLPDQGEVWALEWTDETGEDDPAAVVVSVMGAALPYRLRRRATVEGDCLALSYTLDNQGPDPLAFQWAPHPLIAADPDAAVYDGPGWAAVVDAGSKAWLRFAWDPAELPWARAVVEAHTVPLPTTADGDSLEDAVSRGAALVVDTGQSASWTLRAVVGAGPPF